ncbi:MAG: endoribonuclease L-PSP, TdcF protein [Candidatus Peregrinibacteria bacterium GW2011_GWF2_33_10]|nr:MAG: endoribonuclease L-PSP, TdcF protein [Candidatus Peregrinibacteria bacterium GW2011_GWF2_33_10]
MPIGPYNQAILTGNMLFVSGQIGVNPKTKLMENNSIKEETIRVLENVKAILNEVNMDFSNIIKATIFITDMNNFSAVNEVYASYFLSDFPARECVEVSKLPANAKVEISVISTK